MTNRRVTLKDVANRVGVTPATVSMVINNKENISKETKDKVWKVIKDMGYYPNIVARGLATRKTNTIAVVIPDLSATFAIEVMQGIKEKLNEPKSGLPYSIILYDMMGFYGVRNISGMFKRIIGESRVDGVIIIGHDATDEDTKMLKSAGLEVMVISSRLENTDSIYADDRLGGFIAGEHLINKGFKKIALVANKNQIHRKNGFMDAMEKYNYKIDDDLIFDSPSNDIYAGYKIGEEMLEKINDIDAVFVAANDLVAIGMMKIFKKSKINIPNDIAIVGYDDIPAAEMVTPDLTTIRQPMKEMGYEAISMIVGKIEGKVDDKLDIMLKPKLIERESSQKI